MQIIGYHVLSGQVYNDALLLSQSCDLGELAYDGGCFEVYSLLGGKTDGCCNAAARFSNSLYDSATIAPQSCE